MINKLIAILAFMIKVSIFNTSILSKSEIQMCTQTNNTTIKLNCTQNLVLALSIENGKSDETENIEVFITSVKDTDGETRQIQSPYKININKTPVFAKYPATYVQDFNYRPVEQVISSDVFSCTDGDLAPEPTCGWVMTQDKLIVPYSQGFCCRCDFSQIIGIDTTTRNRGSNCNFLNIGVGSATAHCLRFDTLWYSAYDVKTYIIDYEITITITSRNSTDHASNIQKLDLSPSNGIAASSDSQVIARLIGDFQPSAPPTDYSNYYLVIPSHPPSHSMVLEGPINWMLIPKNFFTLDGRECDKIGVGYFAFRSQASRCTVKIGECLHNQIHDLYMSDIQSMSMDKTPRYLIFTQNSKKYDFFSSTNKKTFTARLSGLFNTLITLELNADDIKGHRLH